MGKCLLNRHEDLSLDAPQHPCKNLGMLGGGGVPVTPAMTFGKDRRVPGACYLASLAK